MQGLNLCLLSPLHWQADSLSLCHLGSPVNVSWGGKEQNLWCEVAKVLPWPSHHLSQRPLVSPWSSLGLTPCWDGVVLYCLFAQDDWP